MRSKYFVPVAEMWCKIGVGFLMVHIVFIGSSVDAKRYQTRRRPREVVATVILNRNVDVEYHECPCGEQVASQDHRIQSGPETYSKQLPTTETLRRKSKRRGIIMMNSMEGYVQPADPVMEKVPDKVLEVKEQEVG